MKSTTRQTDFLESKNKDNKITIEHFFVCTVNLPLGYCITKRKQVIVYHESPYRPPGMVGWVEKRHIKCVSTWNISISYLASQVLGYHSLKAVSLVVSKSRVELQWPEKGFNSQECSIKTSSLVFPFLKHFNHTLQNTDQMAEILKTIQKTWNTVVKYERCQYNFVRGRFTLT